jgi:hypothetical protein
MALEPGVLAGRVTQVSIFNPAISHGDPWGTLVRHTGLALAAFFVRGDRIPRHNLPWRPIFDPALALAFVAGVGVAFRRRGAGWFVLLWVGAMLLPTILAEDTPHFLRGVGIQPVVFLLPALGLQAACTALAPACTALAPAWQWLAERRRTALAPAWVGLGIRRGASACFLVAATFLASLASTGHAYFGRYARAETVYYHFESGSRDLAAQINGFLGPPPHDGSRVAFVSRHLWQAWPSLRFLLPESPALQVISDEEPPPAASATKQALAPCKQALAPCEALLATWPFEPYLQALTLLPPGSVVEVTADLDEQGDLDPEPRPLALLFRAVPYEGDGEQAVFERGIRLLEAASDFTGDRQLRVRLVWQADEALDVDYTVFVQVLRGQAVLGQHDGPPADGWLPTTLWAPGSRIVDVHQIDLPTPYEPETDLIIVGLYELGTMARLAVVESHLPAQGDAIVVRGP